MIYNKYLSDRITLAIGSKVLKLKIIVKLIFLLATIINNKFARTKANFLAWYAIGTQLSNGFFDCGFSILFNLGSKLFFFNSNL